MRKEILPEMFNYNKYPGPDFVYVADLLKSDACQFTVLENHASLISTLDAGTIEYVTGGERHSVSVGGGFVDVDNNRVAVCVR